MPTSSHREYIRENPQNETAILFVHGILGTPDHFRDFVKCVPETYAVYNILLDGHGATARNFSKSSMRLWKKTVSEKIGYLSERYQQIVIVGHSMGALFAIDAGIRFPGKVKQLFLIAVPLKIFLRPSAVSTSLKIAFNRVRPGDRVAMAAMAACSVEPAKEPFAYLGWLPRFWELLREAGHIRRRVGSLAVPTLAFQSQKDELVSMASCKYLYGSPGIFVQILPNSMHYYYDKTDYETMLKAFSGLL